MRKGEQSLPTEGAERADFHPTPFPVGLKKAAHEVYERCNLPQAISASRAKWFADRVQHSLSRKGHHGKISEESNQRKVKQILL